MLRSSRHADAGVYDRTTDTTAGHHHQNSTTETNRDPRLHRQKGVSRSLPTCEPASFERALGTPSPFDSPLVLVMIFAKSTDILVSPEIALGQTQSNKFEVAPTVAVLTLVVGVLPSPGWA